MLTVLEEVADAIEDHIREMAKIGLEPGAGPTASRTRSWPSF